MSERRDCSSSTGSASCLRRYDCPSPIRSRKRRYSVKQPRAMCWPLSGGGFGSSSRSGSVCTAPPSVGRDSCTVTSAPPSTSSSAAARPARPPPTTATLTSLAAFGSPAPPQEGEEPGGPLPGSTQDPARDDGELRRRGQPARGGEDVEAVRLHAVELAAIETGERRHAERAAAVERVEQPQTLVEMRARTGCLE